MKTTVLALERIISANPEDVFDIWVDSKSPGSPWFGSSRVILRGWRRQVSSRS